MSSQPTTYLTREVYLAFERGAEYKNEHVDGEVRASIRCARALREVYEKVVLPE